MLNDVTAPDTLSMRDKLEFGVAQLLVWPMRAVTPFMMLSCPLLLSPQSLAELFPSFAGSWLHYALAAYSISDILFYVWFRKTLRAAQALTSPPVIRLDVHQRVWRAILHSSLPGDSPFFFLSTWVPVPLQQVGREDIRNCLAVGFFGKPLDRLRAGCQEVQEVDRMLAEVERGGLRFPQESPPDMPRLHHLPVDPVPALHRPLFTYMLSSLLDHSSDVFIRICGFRRVSVGTLRFWVREGRNPPSVDPWGKPPPQEPPLVFVHGVGLGLVTYLPFLRVLFAQSTYRTVLLLELPHVSMKLSITSFPPIQTIADLTEKAMQQLHLPAAQWVCHSLGTFVFAGINRLKPHLIDSCVLVDPVCFLLWEATTMNNFCYCIPTTPLQIVQQYHVCRELLISWYFQRHFYFSDAVLLREDVPTRALVVISEDDNIYDTQRVRTYLREGNVEVKLFPGTQHGAWLMSSKQTEQLLHAITTLYERN